MNQSSKAIKGVFWSSVERFSTQGIGFVITVILARLLTPADYGTIALVSAFMIILQTINESGFNVALMNKLDRDELDYSSVFILNIVLGLVLYLILFFSASIIASFFNNNDLILLIRVLGLNLIISSFIIIQSTIFTIYLDFKTQAKASLSAAIISGCSGITCAFFGLGVWALIIQSLLGNIVNCFILWSVSKWKPRKLHFSFKRLRVLFLFAYKLILARLINTIFIQIYSIIIGKIFSPVLLGLFNRAKSIQDLSSSNITNIIQRVSVPMLCEEQNNYQRMSRLLIKYIESAAFFVYPLLFGLFVLSNPFIEVLFTDKWLGVVWILKLMCPVGLLYVISTFNLNIFNATGRTDLALKVEILKKAIFVIILIIATTFGFKALIISQVIIAFLEAIINMFYTKMQIGLSMFQQIFALRWILLSSFIMAIIVYLVTLVIEKSVLKLVIGIFIGIFSYSLISYIFNINNCKIYFKYFIKKL